MSIALLKKFVRRVGSFGHLLAAQSLRTRSLQSPTHFVRMRSKLSILSSCASVKADVSVLPYLGHPIKALFQTLPVCILTSPGIMGTRSSWPKFKKHLTKFMETGPPVTSIQLELEFHYEFVPENLPPLSRVVNNIKEVFPQLKIILSFLSPSWHTRKAYAFLRTLGVVLTTYYLENELLESGWAHDHPSKRSPDTLVTFAPSSGGDIHIVLWGTLGKGWGSYSDVSLNSNDSLDSLRSFIPQLAEKIMRMVRLFDLKNIWIELRNDMGRMDFPFPPMELNISQTFWGTFDHSLSLITAPKASGPRNKPSVQDAINIREEWDRQIFLLDGLKY